jgi:hypothetical protein
MPKLSTIYDYMRTNANLLGARILEQFPALHQIDDALSPRIEGLLRKPFPAQAIAIMGLANRWQQARTGMVVAECGTGKTLISLGAIHVHSGGRSIAGDVAGCTRRHHLGTGLRSQGHPDGTILQKNHSEGDYDEPSRMRNASVHFGRMYGSDDRASNTASASDERSESRRHPFNR